ncbi:hypothetical protein EH223_11970 [candidate division KSB1 bacterium]|nr:hypothetical protein [candidate division KSB1 bacterium]RQW02713.1 MAG: hypothetical protein EH223_11970 [candidate division KSB1 bacterium]
MPITYDVSANGTFVYFTATGVLDVPDFEEVVKKTIADERIQPGFRQLLDLTSISSSRLTEESLQQLKHLARSSPKVTKNSQLAIVVSSGPSFERARNYEKMAHENFQDIIVFNSLQTAKIWLGVED